MLHCAGFCWGSWFATHHADEGDKTFNKLCVGMGTKAWSIVETVFEAYTDC